MADGEKKEACPFGLGVRKNEF